MDVKTTPSPELKAYLLKQIEEAETQLKDAKEHLDVDWSKPVNPCVGASMPPEHIVARLRNAKFYAAAAEMRLRNAIIAENEAQARAQSSDP